MGFGLKMLAELSISDFCSHEDVLFLYWVLQFPGFERLRLLSDFVREICSGFGF